MNIKRASAFLLPIAGIVALATYFNITVFGIPLSDRLQLLLAFAIGPVAILGMLQIERQLSGRCRGYALRAGITFLVIAFAMFCLMLVVQQSIFATLRSSLASAGSETAKESIRQIFYLVNQVQLGIDVTFDIFYTIGMVILSIALLSLNLKQKILGVYGIAIGIALLALNLLSFPTPPDEAGLIDFGPATGLFWVALVVFLFLERRASYSTT